MKLHTLLPLAALLLGLTPIAQAQLDPDAAPPAAVAPSTDAVLGALPLPASPQPQNLIPLDLQIAQPLQALIDAASVRIDGPLVSYTLVVRASGGVDNVSFETVDCDGRRWRTLALRDAQGWRRLDAADWRPLGAHDSLHGALAQDDLCSMHAAAGNARQIVESLRLGRRGGIDVQP